MKNKSVIFGGGLALLLGALVLYISGNMPGTIHRDANGFIHGTGQRLYHYAFGPLMLEEHYSAGHLKLSRWFRPDGSLVAETRWQNGDGVGYYLRQDGTIRIKMDYRNEQADGPAIYYKEDGLTVDHIAVFRDGREMETKN